MLFAQGETRWVLLTTKYAIKIARIRPLKPFIRFFKSENKKETGDAVQQKRSFILRAFHAFFPGLAANIIEYRLYKKYQHPALAKTYFTFLGLVNLQERGALLEETEIRSLRTNQIWKAAVAKSTNFERGDVIERHQFCVVNGLVRLADYGHTMAAAVLDEAIGNE